MPDTPPIKDRLLDAILPNVAFDGWTDTAFDAALQACDVSADQAALACPRGALDLAVHMHRQGDQAMAEALQAEDLSALRYRDRVAQALWLRLQVVQDKEAVQRATTLYALPQHAAEGAQLIWGTADAVWRALGDTSDDFNWYSKRATLSAVWGSVVLFWLGDTSENADATRAFIDRRIDNVMQIEKAKAGVRAHPVLSKLAAPLDQILGRIKAPGQP